MRPHLAVTFVPRGHARGASDRLDVALDELPDDGIRRRLDGLRGPGLDDEPLMQHGHAIGDAEDLGDLVADHDRGEAELLVQLQDQVVNGVDENGVEARGRLVEEDDLGLVDEGPGDRHALAHAARDLRRVLVAHAGQAHLLELLLDAALDLACRQARLFPQREGDVVGHRHRVEEGPALEYDPVAPPDLVEGARRGAG